jgi:hypothetical protein
MPVWEVFQTLSDALSQEGTDISIGGAVVVVDVLRDTTGE